MNIKNPRRLFYRYIKKFEINIKLRRLITEQELNINKSLFEQKYLPKLRDLYLITIVPKDKHNLKIIRELEDVGKNVALAKSRYYFFTPKTSKINLIFDEFIKKFGNYLKNREKILSELDNLMNLLQRYELETTTSAWSSEMREKDKKDYMKNINKIKKPNNTQKEFLKKIYGETHFMISDFLVSCFKANPVPRILVVKLKMEIETKTNEILELLNQDINVKRILDIESQDF